MLNVFRSMTNTLALVGYIYDNRYVEGKVGHKANRIATVSGTFATIKVQR